MKYEIYATSREYAFKKWKEFVNEMLSQNIEINLSKVKREALYDCFIFIYKQKKIKPVQVVYNTNGKITSITTLKSYTIGFFNGFLIGLIVGFMFLIVVK